MALVAMRDMLDHARHNGYAVSAFRIYNLEFLEGILAAAENFRAPVILSLSASPDDPSHLEIITAAAETAARRTSIPIALHLEGCASLADAVQGINLGCNSIGMAAAQGTSASSDVELTRHIAGVAHSCGIPVSAYATVTAGENTTGQFVKQTDIDFLSISVGDMDETLAALKSGEAPAGVPLIITHDEKPDATSLSRFIANGVAMVVFDKFLTETAAARLPTMMKQNAASLTALLSGMRDTVTHAAEYCLQCTGSEGQASAALTHCSAWMPVEHLIIYNVSGISDHATEAMMAEGRRVLSNIPGVRRVVTGKAVKENAAYRYCWLVTFVHPAVIDSYRDHPTHVAFADNLFRPVAAERISIDYQTSQDWTPHQANTMRRRNTR